MKTRMLLCGWMVLCLTNGCCLIRKTVTAPTGLVLKTGVKAGCGVVRCTGGAVAGEAAELFQDEATVTEK